MVAVPIVKEWHGCDLGRQSDRTVSHRLEEARKREGQLRKSIRSRSVLRSGTRVAIWRACVFASALYGLLAQELTAANVTTLRQWYHRSLRAVTGMPAHLTHVSNADLRTKFGLTHNACGWYQTQDTEGSALPAQPEAGQRDSAPAPPSALRSPAERPATAANSQLSQLSCNEAVQVPGLVLPPKPAADPPALPSDLHSPTEGPNGADHSGLPIQSRAVAATAQDAPDSGSNAREEAGQAGTLLAQLPATVGSHDGHRANMAATLEPCSSMTSRTGAELQRSSVWAEFQQLDINAIVHEWQDRLAQHCCICNNWALDKSSVKCHLIRMHAQEWYRVAEQVAAVCKAHKHLFTRDAECPLCHKQVYGVERHALQCPVLFQACFMSCLISAPAAAPNIWHQLKSLTREACIAHLQGSLPVAQEVSEPLNLFCVLCARKDIEASIMDIQAWRKHLQQVHGVAKEVLNTQVQEHAALVHISRPCPFCRLPFQKSPKLHRATCLPLAQLLSVKHGYAGISGDPDCGSVGAGLTNEGDAQLHITGSQGQRREGEACQISQTGQRSGQRPAGRAKAPGASRRRGDGGPGPGVADRATNNPHSAGETRSGTQPSGGRSHLRALFLDHRNVDPDHATHGDEPLAGAVRAGEVHDHTPGGLAYESVDGTGSQADKVRAGCGSHQGDDGPGPFSGCPAPLGLYSMEPTGEEGSGHRPTASDIGRVEGRDQDAASGSYDGGRHPQIRTHAEAGREHLRSGCGFRSGVNNEIQSGESPCGDDQIGKLGSTVANRPAPSPGEAPAQPVGQGFGRPKAVSSSWSPHCREHRVFSEEASLASPSCASVCVPVSSMANQHHREGGAENPVDSRLRSPHRRGASSQPADYGGKASLGTVMPFLGTGGGTGACTLTLAQAREGRNRGSAILSHHSPADRAIRVPKPPYRGRHLGGSPPHP